MKGATTVRYLRDVADRIVERKVNGATVARYAYSASGDTGDATLDALGTSHAGILGIGNAYWSGWS